MKKIIIHWKILIKAMLDFLWWTGDFCIFFKKFIYLLIYFGCAGPLLLLGFFSSWHKRGLLSRSSERAPLVAEPGLDWAQTPVVAARGLRNCSFWAPEHRLSTRGARAQLLFGMWDLPGSETESVSPTLAGGFLATEPPGKPCIFFFTFFTFPNPSPIIRKKTQDFL